MAIGGDRWQECSEIAIVALRPGVTILKVPLALLTGTGLGLLICNIGGVLGVVPCEGWPQIEIIAFGWVVAVIVGIPMGFAYTRMAPLLRWLWISLRSRV